METLDSYKKQRKALINKKITCVEITRNYIKKIKDKKQINAFIEVFEKEALIRAKEIDKKIEQGNYGKLAGMVIGIKDNICYKGHKVSAASKILQDFESLFSATAVERLIKEDAIIIGRLNCDEFAMGSGNENTIYNSVKNPIDNKKVAGGSSGGSAAAVAAGLCVAALGSDTGGSIRQPASFCGVVGIKPTYSRVSRHGLVAYASSFDQIGPITKTVDDAALLLEVISGKDEFDSTVSLNKVDNLTENFKKKKNYKIAYISECLEMDGLDPEIKILMLEKINSLKENGNIVEAISFPNLKHLVPTYYVLTTAEASSNLSRYDGVHYGYRSKSSETLEEVYFNSRTEGFGEEVKRRIMLGTFVLSAGYYDAYYTKAQKIRRIIYNETKQIFKEFDFLISPTTPHSAFDIGRKYSDPTVMFLEDIFTVHANLSGSPAISLPIFIKQSGMPVGFQVMADKFNEKQLFLFSRALQNEKAS